MEQAFVHPIPTAEAQRQRVADFIHAHREAIKQGFRARIAAGDRGLYDSSDFFSTVQRRADQLARIGDEASSRDMRRVLHEIMLEAMSDHARATLREARLRRQLADSAQPAVSTRTPRHGEPADDESLERLHLSPEDLQLARLRANGLLHRQVAAAFGVSAGVIRTRWQRLVGRASDARRQTDG